MDLMDEVNEVRISIARKELVKRENQLRGIERMDDRVMIIHEIDRIRERIDALQR